ncbi:unnamed protein product [Leptidea sinapis]|uniref:Secreted protein n=1 Tax=Leptidea sinapis TaxID=189913 RepID=A0A5E4Q7Y0_9NEOP|nr:unnamed protein product [Leptidea sinapis]
MSLVSAVAAVLAVLLLVLRHRHSLADVFFKNITNIKCLQLHNAQGDFCLQTSPAARKPVVTYCWRPLCGSSRPKYKSDPEIDVDHERIGHHPFEK